MFRYLSYEYLLCYGKAMNYQEFSVVDYNRFAAFPKQSDNSSCGVHVCAAAKALCTESVIGFRTNPDVWLRHYIINDIKRNVANSCTSLSPVCEDVNDLPNLPPIDDKQITIKCPQCKKSQLIYKNNLKHWEEKNFRCSRCDDYYVIITKASQVFKQAKHDSRESELHDLYTFINNNVLERKLPEPTAVLMLSLNPEMRQRGVTYLTQRHERKFQYIEINGVKCNTYQELYEVLVHEISHVITAQNYYIDHTHQQPYKTIGAAIITKLNQISKNAPGAFKGLVLDNRITLSCKL